MHLPCIVKLDDAFSYVIMDPCPIVFHKYTQYR